MDKIHTSDELMEHLHNLDKENSICQVFIPGKGKFTIVFQEEDNRSISDDVLSNPELGIMLNESMKAYNEGKYLETKEFIKSLHPRDFGN